MNNESPFTWQLSKVTPLTQHTLDNLHTKVDFFGKPFAVGDQVLSVVLITKANCCGFRNDLVQLHKDSIERLELKYRHYGTKMGIPRYVLKTL